MSQSVEDDGGSSVCPSSNSAPESPRQEQRSNESAASGRNKSATSSNRAGNGLLERLYFRLRGRKNSLADQILLEGEGSVGLRRFSYKELLRATAEFSPIRKLGGLGYGSVYKGLIGNKDDPSQGPLEVAVKRFNTKSIHRGESEYVSEMKLLGGLRHANIVQILGWCCNKDNLYIVYEFVPNGSLDSYLFTDSRAALPWEARWKIIRGLVHALLYLQDGTEMCAVHRDIKPANVLLDLDFNPKLASFELARFLKEEYEDETILVVGTLGYIAPEYSREGRYRKESDVYALGVLALEVACGKRLHTFGRNLQPMLWKLYEEGELARAADPRLWGQFDDREMERLLLLGLWCTQEEPRSRPSIRLVLEHLDVEIGMPGNITTLLVPPRLLGDGGEEASPYMRQVLELIDVSTPDPGNIANLPMSLQPWNQSHPPFSHANDSQTICFNLLGSIQETPLENTGSPGFGGEVGTADPSPSSSAGSMEEELQIPEEPAVLQVTPASEFTADDQNVAFDIGIPSDYSLGGNRGPLRERHRHIVNGLVASLHQVLRDCNVQQPVEFFDEMLESVRKYTGFLASLDAPLDEWSSHAQLVLRATKEMPEFLATHGSSEAATDAALSSLLEEIQESDQALRGDAAELERVGEELRRAKSRRCSLAEKLADLEKQIEEAEEDCRSMEEKAKEIHERLARHRLSLDLNWKKHGSIELLKSLHFK